MFQNHHTHLNYQTLVIFANVYFNVLGFFFGYHSFEKFGNEYLFYL